MLIMWRNYDMCQTMYQIMYQPMMYMRWTNDELTPLHVNPQGMSTLVSNDHDHCFLKLP